MQNSNSKCVLKVPIFRLGLKSLAHCVTNQLYMMSPELHGHLSKLSIQDCQVQRKELSVNTETACQPFLTKVSNFSLRTWIFSVLTAAEPNKTLDLF